MRLPTVGLALLSLFVQPPKAPGYRLDLSGDRIRIGRSAGSDIRLPEDLSLSRHHAEIYRDAGGLMVRDMGSRNGTFVNSRPVPETGLALSVGDTVSIGETLITLEDRRQDPVALGGETALMESTGTLILRMEDLLAEEQLAKPAADRGQLPESQESRLLARIGRHLAMFEAVSQAGNLLRADRPLEEILSAMLQQIFDMVPAQRGAIVLFEGDEMVSKATRFRDPEHAGETIQISRSIKEMAVKERAAVSTLDAQSDPRFAERASIKLSGIRSAICAPLYTGKDVLGLLYVDTLVADRTFGWDELTLLSTLAVIAAMKVDNHRLLRAYLEKERLERELDIAREISEALLPSHPPEIASVEVFARNVPCRAIGGDYFDIVEQDGALHFVIADVCGKGIPAALMMASLGATFRAYLRTAGGPADLLKRLNDTLVLTTPANKYATVFYGSMDLASGDVTYCNAGHNAPIWVDRDGTTTELSTGGLICGMFEHATYGEGRIRLGQGDLIVMYTDGLPDEESRDGQRLGTERLVRWCRELMGEPLERMGRAIFERVDAWCQGKDRFDDRTLLVVRRSVS